tara:strand:- start:710 stop:1171 length:462 start_codon:yes stop_codon:yes gene_type:complete
MNNTFKTHNHKNCISTSLFELEKFCRESDQKLTKIRRKVLEILLESHKALGAYEILDKLKSNGFPSQPPVAYRAINFLLKVGFVHKIEKFNTYIACSKPGKSHKPAFLICRKCNLVSETIQKSSNHKIFLEAKNNNFCVENSIIEIIGVCQNC